MFGLIGAIAEAGSSPGHLHQTSLSNSSLRLRITYAAIRLSRLYHVIRDGSRESYIATLLANSGLAPKLQFSQLDTIKHLLCCKCGKEANDISPNWNLSNIFKISKDLVDIHLAPCAFRLIATLDPNIPTMQGLFVCLS